MTGVPVSAEGPSHPSPESPSDLLRRAADLIGNLAADRHLAPPPWVADGSEVYSKSGPLVLGVPWDNDGAPDPDAAWIATLNPSVATPLVVMFRYYADVIVWAKSLDEVDRHSGVVDLALQILGETP